MKKNTRIREINGSGGGKLRISGKISKKREVDPGILNTIIPEGKRLVKGRGLEDVRPCVHKGSKAGHR